MGRQNSKMTITTHERGVQGHPVTNKGLVMNTRHSPERVCLQATTTDSRGTRVHACPTMIISAGISQSLCVCEACVFVHMNVGVRWCFGIC